MGIDLIFELIVELIFELVGEGVVFIYLKLMCLIVPQKKNDPCARENAEHTVKTFSVILMAIIAVGLIFIISGDSTFHTVGLFMTYIPLAVISVQIIAGICLKIAKLLKKQK